VVAVVLLVETESAEADGPAQCPASYAEKTPLILVSVDGFKVSYRLRGHTPTINAFAEEGVSAPFMIPSYPTVTFPNHYTIVTGVYPETHGIIANSFYDPEFKQTFSLGDPTSNEGKWWGAEPIWNTLTKQGEKSATFFWPGSDADVQGLRPTYWEPYNGSVPYEDRVDKVLEWVTMAPEDRPRLITLYFDEPDHNGHGAGPDSAEVNAELDRIDSMVARLLDGLEDAGLRHCVDVVLVADHGMAASGSMWTIKLKDYIPDIYDIAYTFTGAFSRINLKSGHEEQKQRVMEKLAGQRPDLRQFERRALPLRFHFTNNRRIEDIVLDLDPGRTTSLSDDWSLMGNHGYDNYHAAMHALFAANGPSFKKGAEVRPFQNIQLYELMCHLTGVIPAPNNGTPGALNDMLVDPPLLEEVLPEPLPVLSMPSSDEVIEERLSQSECPGDLTTIEDWLYSLDFSAEERIALDAEHIPWGAPVYADGSEAPSLLYHVDHITAYSTRLKIPLWTSFSLDPTKIHANRTHLPWLSDVRLSASDTTTCAANNLSITEQDPNAVMAHLFPPRFARDESLQQVPFLLTNALPSTTNKLENWRSFTDLIETWLGTSQLNIVLGPVFDRDYNSNKDDYTSFTHTPTLPTGWFAVLARCSLGGPVVDCPEMSLSTRAFVYPTMDTVQNTLSRGKYALMFSATIDDVTTATGLTFFSNVTVSKRLALETAVHPTLWPL